MDLAFTSDEQRFRDEVRTFLDRELTTDLRAAARLTTGAFAEPDIALEWQRILHRRGWLAYFWPQHAGGPGWTPIQRYLFEKECALAGAPVLPAMGLKLVGPVLYTYGTADQQQRFLPKILTAEHFWAQGFSEPGSGSDLASLRTRAVRDGDRYIVNGAKIWTTLAQHANWIFCLVRTDPDAKPQRGISFLLLPMDQPGITVRPIISSSLDHEVNEVFFDNAVALAADRVGEEGQGWSIAKFLLENERGGTSFAPKLLADIAMLEAGIGAGDGMADQQHRLRLARMKLAAEALEITELRILADMARGRPPGAISLTVKLTASEIRQQVDELALDLHGLAGLQLPAERPFHRPDMPQPVGSRDAQVAAARYLNSRAWTIFGGSSEIQLGIIARLALDL